jgi:ATP-binding cassette, subfamily C, bacterial LapB
MAVDAPFAIVFLILIGILGGPWLAAIPLVFLFLSLAMGFYFKRKSDRLAEVVYHASNFKTGLLVESIEGAETIKSGQSGWRMLQRWMNSTDEARASELEMRTVTENAQHITAAFQQVSYALLVATGALMVSRGEVTMGGLIACSILSGRVLTPIAGLPALYLQWSSTKVSVKMLNSLWSLQDDHHGQEQAIALQTIKGQYMLEKVASSYGQGQALQIEKLQINPGEKIGVLGPVGAGKTTLLRLLSGMYKPQAGMVKLDGIDMAHISKPVLAERVGYLQQEGRLFAGTLRENLVLGLIDPGDEVILEAARITGLVQSVIGAHPQGLQQPIHEGGQGLSSGQRQLVNLTRVFLRRPRIWLLDEPTASMDGALEQHIITALAAKLQPEDVLVVVTHKPDLLRLVSRIIVVANHQVVMDGPRDAVLQRLSAPRQAPAEASAKTTAQGATT